MAGVIISVISVCLGKWLRSHGYNVLTYSVKRSTDLQEQGRKERELAKSERVAD